MFIAKRIDVMITQNYSAGIFEGGIITTRVVCPNFGHPAPTLSFTKYKFMQAKYSFKTNVNGLSVFKLFQLSNGDLLIL